MSRVNCESPTVSVALFCLVNKRVLFCFSQGSSHAGDASPGDVLPIEHTGE